MKNNWITIIILIIVLLGLILRLFLVDMEVRDDEGYTLWEAKKPLKQMYDSTRTGDPHPPGYYVLLHLWVLMCDNLIYIRMLNIILSLASIILIYLFGSMLINKHIGLVVAFLTSINPYLISESINIRMYSLVFFLTLLSYYIFYKHKNLLLLGLINAIGMSCHYFFGLIILTQLIISIINKRFKKYALAIIIFIPYYVFLAVLLKQKLWMKTGDNLQVGMLPLQVLSAVYHQLIGILKPSYYNPLFILIAIIVFFYLYAGITEKHKNIIMILMGIAIPIICLVFLCCLGVLDMEAISDRYLIMILPFLLILLGIGIVRILTNIKTNYRIITYVILWFLIINLAGYSSLHLEKNKMPYANIKYDVADIILLYPDTQIHNLRYYSDKEVMGAYSLQELEEVNQTGLLRATLNKSIPGCNRMLNVLKPYDTILLIQVINVGENIVSINNCLSEEYDIVSEQLIKYKSLYEVEYSNMQIGMYQKKSSNYKKK